MVWFKNLSVIAGCTRKVGKVSCFFLHENSFLTVRGNHRQFFENVELGIDELIIHSLMMMCHLLLCHIQLYEKMTTFVELGSVGQEI